MIRAMDCNLDPEDVANSEDIQVVEFNAFKFLDIGPFYFLC